MGGGEEGMGGRESEEMRNLCKCMPGREGQTDEERERERDRQETVTGAIESRTERKIKERTISSRRS